MQIPREQINFRDYQVVVNGRLELAWTEWMAVTCIAGETTTTLILTMADQTALRGLLSRLWDLNLTVISVNPVVVGPDKEDG